MIHHTKRFGVFCWWWCCVWVFFFVNPTFSNFLFHQTTGTRSFTTAGTRPKRSLGEKRKSCTMKGRTAQARGKKRRNFGFTTYSHRSKKLYFIKNKAILQDSNDYAKTAYLLLLWWVLIPTTSIYKSK